MPGLSVVIVTYNSRSDIERALPPLLAQMEEGDELIVVDNGSTDGTAGRVTELAPLAQVIANPGNEGFAAACNQGAAAAAADLLLLLNPDTEVAAGCIEQIRAADGGRWAGWQALATRSGGEVVNTSGNLVHFTGFSWAGADGSPVSGLPAEAAEIPSLSGVAMAVPRATWERLGGFPADFVSYHEDTDFSQRLRLGGGRLAVIPGARVEHHYEFAKPGGAKWRNLERNRWAWILRDYPGPLLALVMPALLLTELALLPISLAGGWLGAKLRADLDVASRLPRLLGERRRIQASRQITSREFAEALVPELDSDYFGAAARLRPLRWGLRAYWSLVLVLLGGGSSPRSTDRSS